MKKAPVTAVAGAFSFHVCARGARTSRQPPRKGWPRVVGNLLLRDNNHGVAGSAGCARGTGGTGSASGTRCAGSTTARAGGARRAGGAGRTCCAGVTRRTGGAGRTRRAGGTSFASRAGRTRNGHHGRRRRDHRAVTSGQAKSSDQGGQQNGIFHGSLSEFERKMRAKLCADSFSCLGLVLPKIISG
jgi:hypothetical protein